MIMSDKKNDKNDNNQGTKDNTTEKSRIVNPNVTDHVRNSDQKVKIKDKDSK
jgi:hypothetical protein